MIDLDFTFTAELWEWQGKGSWVFVTLPADLSADIKHFTRHLPRGFGSVRVAVSVGATTWKTSVFPHKEQGGYILPIKKAVRTAEALTIGDTVDFAISVEI